MDAPPMSGESVCEQPGCEQVCNAKGLCRLHYDRQRRANKKEENRGRANKKKCTTCGIPIRGRIGSDYSSDYCKKCDLSKLSQEEWNELVSVDYAEYHRLLNRF